MAEKYDLVVVGSGMGGMCSGALAVKNGYKTLYPFSFILS